MNFELIIIGAGPAGTSAAVYAARKRLKTLLLAPEFGGQSIVSERIENWIGTPAISGSELAKSFENHIQAYAGTDVTVAKESALKVAKAGDEGFVVTTDNGKEYHTKAILVATGSSRRRLDIPGADEFEHKGLTYCASCDGPLFADQDVAVVGGGNAAFETAAQLLAYAKSVTILQRSDRYRADEITIEKVLAHENARGILNATPTKITGDTFVSGIEYRDAEGETHTLPAAGIFVEIGLIPTTEFVRDVVPRDEIGRILIDPWTQSTKTPGIWAAGDCTNIKYHQNNIASGDGVRALEDIYVHLKTRA